MLRKKIVLVTTVQASLNPRMVKEADSLAANAEYEVIVIGQYWNKWAADCDEVLLSSKKWKFILVGGTPTRNVIYYHFTRIRHIILKKLTSIFSLRFNLAELSLGRCSIELYCEAVRQNGDLYIGHNPAALAVVVKAAKQVKAKCGFDAEDFHRFEYSDDIYHYDVVTKAFLEDKYFKLLDYITCASPLISKEYSKYYPKIAFHVILNTFPKTNRVVYNELNRKPLRLFWFSQTIGNNRGIEEIINAIHLLGKPFIELHILGDPRKEAVEFYQSLAHKFRFGSNQLKFYLPLPPDKLFDFAQTFDVGMATEIGVPFNRQICLTNKLFTYIQSGLAVIASDTKAQIDFFRQEKLGSVIYKKESVSDLAAKIQYYYDNREELQMDKTINFEAGQEYLNWDMISKQFLKIISTLLSH